MQFRDTLLCNPIHNPKGRTQTLGPELQNSNPQILHAVYQRTQFIPNLNINLNAILNPNPILTLVVTGILILIPT